MQKIIKSLKRLSSVIFKVISSVRFLFFTKSYNNYFQFRNNSKGRKLACLTGKSGVARNIFFFKRSEKEEKQSQLGLFPPNPEIAVERSGAKVLVGGKLSSREVYPPKLSCINHLAAGSKPTIVRTGKITDGRFLSTVNSGWEYIHWQHFIKNSFNRGEDERMEILVFTESQKSDFYSGNLNLDSLPGNLSCQTCLPKFPEMFTKTHSLVFLCSSRLTMLLGNRRAWSAEG